METPAAVRLRHLQASRAWRWAGLLLALALAAALPAWLAGGAAPPHAAQAQGQWVAPQWASAAQPIVLDGQLEPGASVQVMAPFDGNVAAKSVQTGDEVQQGAPLLEIVGPALLAEQREAEAAVIRSRQALGQLLRWDAGSEMQAAQRQLLSSRAALQAARRSLDDTQQLHDKGIVARSELQSAQAETDMAAAQLAGAEEGVDAARDKGGVPQRRLAQLEYEGHLARLADIRARLARARIEAPIAGVVLAPPPASPLDAAGAGKDVEVGSHVSAKDTLLTLGDTRSLMVRAALDEFDILRVSPGLPVRVALRSDSAVVLVGELSRVSSQARRGGDALGQGGGRAALFDVQVMVRDVPAELRPRLRVGMGVRLQIDPQAGPAAWLVPLAAVSTPQPGGAQVLLRKKGSGPGQPVPLRLGRTLADQVEVLAGVEAGDEVWVPQAVASDLPGSRRDAGPADAE